MIDFAGLIVGLLLWLCGLVIAWFFVSPESSFKRGFVEGASFKWLWSKWVK